MTDYVDPGTSDPSPRGAPTDWTLSVREVRVEGGFVYPMCVDTRTIPGLGAPPVAEGVDIDENGEIVGLF
jgi:formate--tetrahydrofolate ligase